MPIFYRKAIEAAIHPARADWLTEAHLMDWNGLAAALSCLTPEQRCDAIRADARWATSLKPHAQS